MHPLYTWLAQCGFTGRIGKEVILKRCGKKIIITKYPERKNSKPTPGQKHQQQLFKQAVEYAKNACADAQLRAKYQKRCKPGQTVYNLAIKEFYRNCQAQPAEAL